ncbi:pectate lyase family protein [Pedobacter cryophilus]|uniref:Pectate lyase n=1 Tax=Pedobacter cryophilus TaxID=2571271 RepID=A0A4U1C559_9SPHI|nr:pectate lyase [Pedobacter cryophilus]TKC00509.1 pectate lyase [Pedobacter cryophilus]
MISKTIKVLLILIFISQKNTYAQSIAFPGAEGFGKYTSGGRGGKVYIVTNLNDDGEGSFRVAATAKHPRIIVFEVSGTIHLKSRLDISKNATIAGQTAPGDGICLADYPVSLGGDNIIVRYLRFRMGDRYQNNGMVDGAGSDDAFGGNGKTNIIIDHCSISWSTDEVMSVYRGDSTTLQWNILSEPLNYSYHFETGDKDFEKHGYGGIWGGTHLSAHHNLFAHCNSRNPRFNGARLGATEELVDFRNNVIYNWGHNNVYGGEGGNYNMVNNYYKYGPITSKNVKSRIVNPSKGESGIGEFYVAGNFVDGAEDVTVNNELGVHLDKNTTDFEKQKALVKTPFQAINLIEKSAVLAYADVLKSAGASFCRDTLDKRIIKNVRNRTGGLIDVQGGFKHGTTYEETVNAWPTLKSKKPKKDSDRDGMPDAWEKEKGLNPALNDASLKSLANNYTNIEIYINSLVK